MILNNILTHCDIDRTAKILTAITLSIFQASQEEIYEKGLELKDAFETFLSLDMTEEQLEKLIKN